MPLFDVVLDVTFSGHQFISYTVEAENEDDAMETAQMLLSPSDVDAIRIEWDEVVVLSVDSLEAEEE